MRCAAGASSSSVERDESKSLNPTSTLFTHTKIPRITHDSIAHNRNDRSPIVFVVFVVFVVARTEIERVETVITRKRPLEVRRSRGTRHPERARARLGASHDRTARDGGSSLRRRAKAGKTNKRTNVRASGQSRCRALAIHASIKIKLFARIAASRWTRRRVDASPVGTISGGLDLAGRYRDAGRYGFPSGVSIRPLATRTLGRRIASRVPDDGSGGELSRHLYRSACGYDVCRYADASS